MSRPLAPGAHGFGLDDVLSGVPVGAAMVPLLTLGLPGSPVMAVLAGALMIHALVPGPGFIALNPDLFAALMASLIGVHSVQNALFDVWLMPAFGVFRRSC